MVQLHRHHIVPTHAGGTDDPSNIALLTVEQHAEAHRVLFEQYGRWQDRIAWHGLAGIIGHEDAVRQSQMSMLGKTHSEETKRKMSESAKKRHQLKPFSAEVKLKMGNSRRGENNPMAGKEFSTTHRERLSQALKGRIITPEWRENISKGKRTAHLQKAGA